MGPSDIGTYLILAYFSHMAARITGQLIPVRDSSKAKLVQDWLSSGFGIMMGFSTDVNVLADAGIEMIWNPAGYIITGILLGQGVKFGFQLMDHLGKVRK